MMNSEIRRKWINALRSRDYRQGRTQLRESEYNNNGYRYCCLGVLCDLYNKETNGDWLDFSRPSCEGYSVDIFTNTVLPPQVMRWAGLEDADPILGPNKTSSLPASFYNDGGETFDQIAERIETML